MAAWFYGIVAYTLSVVEKDVPTIYREAKISSYAKDWKRVMGDEMNSLHKNCIWELVNFLKGKRPLDVNRCWLRKMIFFRKESDTKLGWWQKAKLNRKELTTISYSPVVWHSSIRILLVLVVQLDL